MMTEALRREPGLPGTHSAIDHKMYIAWLRSERHTPNTVITTGPFVGHALLQTIASAQDVRPALEGFVTASFSLAQVGTGLTVAAHEHGKRHINVIVDPGRLQEVYNEGVDHILDAILLLRGGIEREHVPARERTEAVISFLETGDNLQKTQALFAATAAAFEEEHASAVAGTFRDEFDFSKGNTSQRKPTLAEKLTLQRILLGEITPAVEVVGEKGGFSRDQIHDFVFTLTKPTLLKEV